MGREGYAPGGGGTGWFCRKLASASVAAERQVMQTRGEALAWFEALSQTVKARSEARLKISQKVEALVAQQGRDCVWRWSMWR